MKKGDTLSGIARQYGVSVKELKRFNSLQGDLILVGQTLRLPAKMPRLSDTVLAAINEREAPLRKWTTIVAHHSAIDQGNASIYDRAHRRRGMANGLAYHFVIGNGNDSEDGEIEVGPRWKQQLAGGHVRTQSVNEVGIGICLVGNLEERKPTEKQVDALLALVRELKAAAVSGEAALTTHRDVDPGHTLCPGRFFPRERYCAC